MSGGKKKVKAKLPRDHLRTKLKSYVQEMNSRNQKKKERGSQAKLRPRRSQITAMMGRVKSTLLGRKLHKIR